MARRSRHNDVDPPRLGRDAVAVLIGIVHGEVVRDDCNGSRAGMWALYRLGKNEVGIIVRQLARADLVNAPLVGPPSINGNGEQWIRAHEHGVV